MAGELRTTAPHLFPPVQPASSEGVRLSAEERLARVRREGPTGPEKYKLPVVTNPAHLAELAAIKDPVVRRTRARELMAAQGDQ